MGGLFQDVRYAIRSLSRAPGFTLVALVTLAIGIGANTAVFSLVHGVLLEKLPYADEDRLVTVWQADPAKSLSTQELSPANFLDLRERTRAFELIAAAEPYSHSYFGDGDPELFKSWLVTRGFFEILGVPPLLGRTFAAEEYASSSSGQVVVLSHALWQRRFGSDPDVVGRELSLRNKTYTVVGVMPPEFQFPVYNDEPRDLWAPNNEPNHYQRYRQGGWLTVIGRLAPGVRLEQATTELTAIGTRLAEEHPKENAGKTLRAVALREHLSGEARPALLTFLGAVALVLVIACANVANLVLVRGKRRAGEVSVRVALGASRRRLFRLLVVEHLILALVGGLAGTILARASLQLLLAAAPTTSPLFQYVEIDVTVLAFALTASCLSVVMFGVGPALRFSASPSARFLKSRSVGESSERRVVNDVLAVVQVAVALALLCGAGLLTRSFWNLLEVDPGFRSEGVLSLQANIHSSILGDERRAAFVREAVAGLRAVPQISDAAAVSRLPFHASPVDFRSPFAIQGAQPSSNQREEIAHTVVAADYFRVMRIPLLGGRAFEATDGSDAPGVVVINRAAAELYWPGQDPIGASVEIGYPGRGVAEVVGVVANVKPRNLESDAQPEIYLSHAQAPVAIMTFVASTEGDPAALADTAKAAVRRVEPGVMFTGVATIEDFFSESLRERRFSLGLLGVFAFMAMSLACIGLYGLISYRVVSRRAEIGLRMALGARSSDVLAMVVGQSGRLILAGVACGLVLSVATVEFLSSMLFRIKAVDPATLASVTCLMALSGLLAAYLPARRAARLEPGEALRHK